MKFEEKLIKLRKEHALSQEELAEKLDVTRQTVSKWELGQSKPDMEKLVKISNVFNVSIESLTDDNKTALGTGKTNMSSNKKFIVFLLIAILVIAVIFMPGKFYTNLFGSIFDMQKEIFNQMGTDLPTSVNDIFDTSSELIDEIKSQVMSDQEQNNDNISEEEYNNLVNEIQQNYHNYQQDHQDNFNEFQTQYEDIVNQIKSEF